MRLHLQTNISDSNAEQVASDLSHITSSKGNITNRLDVKFTADSVENLVRSKRKLSKVSIPKCQLNLMLMSIC